jgi:hypothetical protein
MLYEDTNKILRQNFNMILFLKPDGGYCCSNKLALVNVELDALCTELCCQHI